MDRPGCVNVHELPEEDRPRRLKVSDGERRRSKVRAVGNSAGLTRMGVWLRTVQPGDAGTARHFHSVEEEWAYVLSGLATLRIGPHRIPVRQGSFASFPPGPAPHHFIASGDRPLVLLEGGERRPREDVCWYVDLGMRWDAGKLGKTDDVPPAELGELSQCLHVDEQAASLYEHPVDRAARRTIRDLSAGLQRQSVRWSRVAAGDLSTAYHTHDRTDEWVYILAGHAQVRVGSASFEVGPGDFIAHPSGSAPHAMTPSSDLEYLMGGMRDPEDVVYYPEAGLMKRHGELTPIENS